MAGSYDWQGSFAAGVLGPSLMGRVDLAKYAVGLREGKNIVVQAHGGFTSRAGTKLVARAKSDSISQRLVPFERDEDTTYVLVMGQASMRIAQRGALLMSGASIYERVMPYSSDQTQILGYIQSVDVMYLAHIDHYPRKLLHYGPTDWDIQNLNVNPDVPTPAAPSVVANQSGDGKVYRYVVSAVIDGIEGIPSPVGEVADAKALNKDGVAITVSWVSLGASVEEYRVYRERGGVFGYIGFTDTAGTSLVDDNIDPNTASTPRTQAEIFTGLGRYPATVTIAQQRLLWAGFRDDPERIVGSVVGDYENYTKAKVTKADDRYFASVAGEKLNRVRAIVDMQQLIAFTGSGEYGIGTEKGVLDTTNPKTQRYGASGSNGLRPLMVGDSILYVDRSGRLVRDLRYDLQSDGYSGSDLTIFIPHFLQGRQIVDWAYCHSPLGTVWVVLDNGHVISLTYKREQEVWAWTEHDFGGEVESVCAIYEDGYDALYLSIKRVIGGELRRFIERMDKLDQNEDVMTVCYLDCAVSYSGAPTRDVTGLSHLEGLTIDVIGDGDVFENLVVEDGAVRLPHAVSRYHAGLPFIAEGETLPLYVELQGTGSSRGLPVKATDAFIQMEKTRGIEVLSSGVESSTPMVQTFGDLSDEIPLFTGIEKFELHSDFNNQGTIRVRQRYPLPMNILGISPKWVIGR